MAKTQLDRLEAVRAKLKKTDFSSGGGGGFWSPPVGKSVIRILPEVGDMQYFFQSVGKHNLTPDGKKHVYCPDFVSDMQLPCPLCEMVEELKRSGDAASKKLAGQLNRKRMFWMNVVVRGKNDEQDRGPFIFTPGVQVFGDIASIIEDPDYGEVFDANKGYDIRIEREGTGLDTEYTVRPRPQPSKLSDDPDEAKLWMSKARDLSYVELSDDPEEDKDLTSGHAVWILPYDRIVREYDLDTLGEEEEEEEVEKPSPKARAVVSKAVNGAKKPQRVVEKVDDEDEDEDIEKEDEEEETPPAKQEVQRRMARRSSRR